MNKYLLLRDNKQTGPHGLAEMLASGFKKYDLVWVEGRSAAWRYPGELEEFKEIAPLVEEQPFDRFFKKPGLVKKELQIQDELAIEQPQKQERAPKEEDRELFENRFRARTTVSNEPQQQHSRSEHKYVAVTFPPEWKPKAKEIHSVPRLEKESAEKESAEKESIVKESIQKESIQKESVQKESAEKESIQPLKFIPNSRETRHEKIVPEPQIIPSLPPQIEQKNIILQYSGVAIALISLLIVGILIGMAVNQQPPPKPMILTEPEQITRLKEKLSQANEPRIPSLPVVNQFPQPQSNETYFERPPAAKQTGVPRSNFTAPNKAEWTNSKDEFLKTLPEPLPNDEKRESVHRTVPEVNQSADVTAELTKFVDLKLNPYKVGMFGGIENIKLTIQNRSPEKLTAAVIELRYILSNKKILTEILRFENVEPGAIVTLTAPDSPRGIRLETRIVKLTK